MNKQKHNEEQIKTKLRKLAETIDSEILNRLKTGNHKVDVESLLTEESILLNQLDCKSCSKNPKEGCYC